jgi:predicted dehydrogenase
LIRADQSVRLGLAGCGRLVERGYLPASAAVPEVHFAALADPDELRMRGVAAMLAAEDRVAPALFDKPADMLRTCELDAVVVAAPAEQHVRLGGLVAERGLPALIEKPPAPDLLGARRIAALRPAPWIGFNRRFLQGVELEGRIPAEGWLELELELCFRRRAWRAHTARNEALLDAGSHLIDLAAFLSRSSPIAVRDAVLAADRARLELELGRARARLRCATDRPHRERITVRDRDGRLLARSDHGAVQTAIGALRGGPQPLVLSLERQLRALAAALRGGGNHGLAVATDGVAAMSAIAAARRSAELGGAEVIVEVTGEMAKVVTEA